MLASLFYRRTYRFSSLEIMKIACSPIPAPAARLQPAWKERDASVACRLLQPVGSKRPSHGAGQFDASLFVWNTAQAIDGRPVIHAIKALGDGVHLAGHLPHARGEYLDLVLLCRDGLCLGGDGQLHILNAL